MILLSIKMKWCSDYQKTDDVKDLKEGAIIVIGYENAYKVESNQRKWKQFRNHI